MMLENVDRRILGALRCVDAVSRTPIAEFIAVHSPTLDIRRSSSGSYVVFNAPGMRDFTTKFDVAPPGPAATPFEVIIEPASTGYLPRRAQVAMPRTVKLDGPNSVMVPQDIPVYMAPSATLLPNWAVVRVAVKKAGTITDERLPWTVLRITRDSDAALLATGMSDKRGEAVLAVAGLGQSANQNGGGAVVATTVDATVTGLFDPSNLQQPKDWLPDPDTVLHNLGDTTLKKNTKTVKIGRGTLSVLTMEINF
jgi:hypothetical protein